MDSVVKVLLECVNRFSISFRWYAFPNYCTQIFRPLAYGVRIPLKVSATTASRTFRLPPVPMSSIEQSIHRQGSAWYITRLGRFAQRVMKSHEALAHGRVSGFKRHGRSGWHESKTKILFGGQKVQKFGLMYSAVWQHLSSHSEDELGNPWTESRTAGEQ